MLLPTRSGRIPAAVHVQRARRRYRSGRRAPHGPGRHDRPAHACRHRPDSWPSASRGPWSAAHVILKPQPVHVDAQLRGAVHDQRPVGAYRGHRSAARRLAMTAAQRIGLGGGRTGGHRGRAGGLVAGADQPRAIGAARRCAEPRAARRATLTECCPTGAWAPTAADDSRPAPPGRRHRAPWRGASCRGHRVAGVRWAAASGRASAWSGRARPACRRATQRRYADYLAAHPAPPLLDSPLFWLGALGVGFVVIWRVARA